MSDITETIPAGEHTITFQDDSVESAEGVKTVTTHKIEVALTVAVGGMSASENEILQFAHFLINSAQSFGAPAVSAFKKKGGKFFGEASWRTSWLDKVTAFTAVKTVTAK